MKTITCLFLFSLLTGIAAAEELMSIWEAHDFIEETEHVSRQKQQEVAQRSIPSHSQTSSEEMTIWEAHDLAEAMEWEFTRDAIPRMITVEEAIWNAQVGMMTIWEARNLARAMEWELTRDAIPPERLYTAREASNYMAWIKWQQRQQAAAYWQRVAYLQHQQTVQNASRLREPAPLPETQQIAAVVAPLPKTQPAPKQESTSTQKPTSEQESTPDSTNAQLKIESDHAITEANLPAKLTREQKAMINDLVTQQLSAERTRHAQDLQAERERYAQDRKQLRFLAVMAAGFFIVMVILAQWSGRRFFKAITDFLKERKTM